MPRLPSGRSYNEFSDEDKARIAQLGRTSAEKHKDYVDRELKPFLFGRTLVLYGQAGDYDSGSGGLDVSVAGIGGNTMVKALGCPKNKAKKLKGKSVRVLLDTRSKTAYYDDQAF